LNNKKILMVDDESRVQYSIKSGLELLDDEIEVKTVDNGTACFEELEKEKPNLILLDINMPEMSGWSVYDKIRDRVEWQHIPIIFLTARTDKIATEAGKFMGNDYFEKPVDIKELKIRIDQLIEKEN